MPDLLVTRAGLHHATLARTRTTRGRTVTLVVAVEVWGAGDRRVDLETRLAHGLAHTFESTAGSHTARLRAAMHRAHTWLAAQAATGSTPVSAGASLLVLAGDEALLAQAGPAVAFGPDVAPPGETAGGMPAPRRHPAASPWLKRGLSAVGPHPVWPPLGLGAAPGVHWVTWRVGPGDRALLATSVTAEALSREVVASLFALAPDALAAGLTAALPTDGAVVLVTRPGSRRRADQPAGAAAAMRAAGSSPPRPTAPVATEVEATPRPTPLGGQVAFARGRARAARLARGSARVLTAVLPSRPARGAESYRAERARLAAAVALALPVLVMILAIAYGRQADGLAPTSAAPPLDQAPLAGPTVPVTDDPAARIIRLDGVAAQVALPGQPEDDRAVVVAAGVPHILNRTRNQVDRYDGAALVTVLRRGQVLGDTPVGDLEDLVLVPGGPGGERVLALDAAGSLWRVDGPGAAPVPRAEAPVWQAVTRAAGWRGQLYALDRATGQVWRYAPAGDAFPTAGVGWLVEPLPLPNVIDMAIDGDVFLLDRDGAVRKYTGGSPLPFQLAEVPEGLPRGRSLSASPNGRGLLITDPVNGRLLTFAADGSFRAQLLFPAQAGADELARTGRMPDLQDAWWDEASAALYVVVGKWLYRAPYPGGQ